jgi:hypothetical protein
LYEGDLLAGEAPGKSGGSRSGQADANGGCPVCGCVAGRAHADARAAAAAAAGSQVEMAALNGAGSSAAKAPGDVLLEVPPSHGGGLGRRWDDGERLVTGASSAPVPGLPAARVEEEEEEECVLSLWGALFWLGVVTVLISFLSDAMMAVINEASMQVGRRGAGGWGRGANQSVCVLRSGSGLVPLRAGPLPRRPRRPVAPWARAVGAGTPPARPPGGRPSPAPASAAQSAHALPHDHHRADRGQRGGARQRAGVCRQKQDGGGAWRGSG